jgi:hypothetical protein
LIKPCPTHRPPLDAMTADAAIIAAVSCVAYLLGRIVSLPVTSLILGLAVPIFFQSPLWKAIARPVELNYTGTPLPESAAEWVPVSPPAWLPWCRVVLFAAVAVAAVLFCARRWRPATALTMALVSGMLGLALTQQASDAVSAFNTMAMRCTGHAPALCIPTEYESERPRLRRQVDRLSGRLQNVRVAPAYYVVTEAYRYADLTYELDPWVIGVEPGATLEAMAESVACGAYCDAAMGHALAAWLAEPPPSHWLFDDQRYLADRLNALSPQQRTDWIGRCLAAARDGATPPPVPTPTPRWSR